MRKTVKLRVMVHSAEKKMLEAEAREVILPGEDGELSIMDFHQHCLYRLRAGQVRVGLRKAVDNEIEKRFPIKHGLANIAPDKVVIICET